MPATITIKVIPKSAACMIAGKRGDEWVVKVTAPADKGKANKQLLEYLAEITDQSLSSITLVRGHMSSHKQCTFESLEPDDIEAIFQENL